MLDIDLKDSSRVMKFKEGCLEINGDFLTFRIVKNRLFEQKQKLLASILFNLKTSAS